jgi:hypothetical protein
MRIFIALCLSVLSVPAFAAGSLTLVEQGLPKAQIVIGEAAPEIVAFAAKELQAFVKAMSGAELPIVAQAAAGTPAIRLGPAARAALPAAELLNIRRDGYVITAAGADLCVVGIDDVGPQTDIEALLKRNITHDVSAWQFQRGTLYGVYRLLEELGMRWFMPGEFGQRTPNLKTLTFSGSIRENPHFITRTVGYWSLGMGGYNKQAKKITIMPGERDAIGFTPVENRMWELRMRGETFRIPLNHNPPRTQWVERFATNHPDYFALLPDGQRATGRREQHLCYTHPDVLKECIADITAFGAGKDAGERGIHTVFPYNRNWSADIALDRYYSVLPNDGFRPCTCPSCRAMVPADAVLVNQQYSKLVWSFVSKCAAAVPDMNVVCLAYGTYSIPYPGMPKLPTNVVVGFCAFSHPASLYYKDGFQRYEKLLGQWAALSHGNLAFWQHYLASNRDADTVGMPEHTPEMYARCIRLMARYGNHAFCEQMADSILFELYNRYLLLKLFYNPQLDEQAIWQDFLDRFYGPAGPLIGEIYADIGRRNVEKIQKKAGQIEYWKEYYTADVLGAYRTKAGAAAAKVAGTPYEAAVSAFSTYYLGLMEVGRSNFLATMGPALSTPNPDLTCRYETSPIVLDGRLDEPGWQRAPSAGTYDVDTGAPSALTTDVKTFYTEDTVYFGITAHDPAAMTLQRSTGEPGTVDGIEIFLDTLHNHQGYYQMTFDLSGRLDERHYIDNIEPARIDWRSKAQWKITVNKDTYVMEIALPRKSFECEGRDLSRESWGAMVGRTVSALEPGHGRFYSTSATLRRRFHQPALFNNLIFSK